MFLLKASSKDLVKILVKTHSILHYALWGKGETPDSLSVPQKEMSIKYTSTACNILEGAKSDLSL